MPYYLSTTYLDAKTIRSFKIFGPCVPGSRLFGFLVDYKCRRRGRQTPYTKPNSTCLPNTFAIFSSVLMVGLALRGFSRRW